jgi:hypothetical protein
MPEKNFDLKLRPHHVIDIITGYGNNVDYQPHPYGHCQHLVVQRLLSDLDLRIKLVLESDDICTGCKHLTADGKCNDVLAQITPSPSKQAYNDVLDCRLFDHFSLAPDCIVSVRKYFEIVNTSTPGIERICTHPKESPEKRLTGLINGLVKSGIRNQ